MTKYRVLLIVLLVFICVMAALNVYGIVADIYSVVTINAQPNLPQEILTRQILSLMISIVTMAFEVFGIVVISRILSDKQLYNTNKE